MCCSVAELCPTLWPRGLQYTRLLCPPLSPRVCSDLCPLSWWCCLTISFFASLFFCPRSSQHKSFLVSQLLASSGQSIGCWSSNKGVSKEYSGLIPLGLTGLISQSRDSGESSLVPQFQSINSAVLSLLWRRKWQPTPVFLPGESQGRRSLVSCRLWGHRVRHDWSDLAAAAFSAFWYSI